MSILAKIAWRNIWRNPRRSWVLISAVAIGVFSFLGAVAYIDGIAIQMLDSAIDLQGGHLQITAEGYSDNPTIRSYVPDVEQVEEVLAEMTGVRYAPLAVTPGMINSAEQASGVQISGVDPRREGQVTSMVSSVVEGRYLSPEGGTNEVLIGAGLAERLNVQVGEKVVLMANDLDNEVSAGAYRIVGLFRTSSSDFDKTRIYLHLDAARDLIGYTPQQASSYTLRLAPDLDLGEVVERVRAGLGDTGLEVVTWRDRSPMLVMMQDMYDVANILLVIILFTAIAFTIINSFLMVIFERIREIGIMSANGVRPRQVRLMLYLEAVFIVLLGTAVGGVLAVAMIWHWSSVGLDLSAFAEGLGSFGISTVIYPYLDWNHIITGIAMIFVMVLGAVLYPAFKASRFETVDAIHYV